METAKTVLTKPKVRQPDWYVMNEKEMAKISRERNMAYDNLALDPESRNARRRLREKRAEVRLIVRRAKRKRQEIIALDASGKVFRGSPREAWEATRTIEASFTGHHRKPTMMQMKKPDGQKAQTDKENQQHFNTIFNADPPPVDIQKVLDQIEQQPTRNDLAGPPTMEELETQIMKANKCEKAPGESGVTPEAYKVMSMESKTILLKILCNVYEGRTDPDEWHEALVKCLHKKGDTSDPNNWRAICLKDMSARLMSGIMNARLIQVIQEYGVKTQFGSQPGLGCSDGLYTLRSVLTTRRYHNQPTWALFVDLVKAFDTVNHELLFN